MKKLCIEEWIKTQFGIQSRPNEETIRRKCRRGEIPNAEKIGRMWFITVEEANYKKKDK